MGAPKRKINKGPKTTTQLLKTHFIPFKSPVISLRPSNPHQSQGKKEIVIRLIMDFVMEIYA
uniref:Putative ovule protein n=1 Tax=Solanum chacoense TaxID=4108 RepID=A0A0V0GJD6_SOLCH